MDAISGLNSADDVEVALMTAAEAEAGATAATLEEDEGFLAMGDFSTDTAELFDPSTASVEALMFCRVSDGVTEADTPPTDAEVSEPMESPLKPFVVDVFNGSALPPTIPEEDASGRRFKD